MLDYLALALLLAVVVILAIAVVALFDLPYRIAVRRNHPQRDAIHAACWLSLFTAGLLWPLAFIWALTVPPGNSDSRPT
jgi:ABC-type anion transport system duplicated permease subunit